MLYEGEWSERVKQESRLLSINVNFVKPPFAKLGTVQSSDP